MSIADFKKLNDKGEPKRPKYGAKKKIVDGLTFDSTKEANRWVDLKFWQQSGQIQQLRHQHTFPLVVNSQLICEYDADFTYFKDGELVVEDTKSKPTREKRDYRIKFKLMEALYGIQIQEI